MFRIPELLAPAGGMEQLKAAVENGADAVYMGGKRFNARINAANFDDQELKEAIDYAHLRGVRLYAAMNTLLRDRELRDALEYAAELYNLGADALIVQELGFAELVKEHIPGFELHLSTQGTIYNASGVRYAKKLGFSRVVLARELTLEEIRKITDEKQLDVEVFAHGALCICYSGQCQMSREIGGRSGNRGECAQPCRLPYTVCRGEKGRAGRGDFGLMQEVAGPHFVLSPKDLCTVEHLGRLAEAGVASLKIEGRMKSAEYVAVVTGIYRKYLDLYARNGYYCVDPDDLRDLNQIFNRGGFTEGYLFGNSAKKLMSGDLPKHQGIYIGKVAGSSGVRKKSSGRIAGKAGNRQSGLVPVQLDGELSVGDGIEIRNRELPGNLVTFMKIGEKRTSSAKKGELVTIGYIDGNISPGDPVYKITDKGLMHKARTSYEGRSGQAEKALRKTGVSFHFSAGLDKPAALRAADEEGNVVYKELSGKTEKALTRATTEESVKSQLSKTGGTPFRMTETIAEMEEGISVPLSAINELRRTVLAELEEISRTGKRQPVRISRSSIDTRLSNRPIPVPFVIDEEIFLYLYRVNKEEIFDPGIKRIYVPYEAILKGFYQNDPRAVPVIPAVTKGWHEYNIRENFDKIVAASAQNGIAVGNPGWIEPFVAARVNVFGDYGMNLHNSMDFYLAGKMGIKEAVISHEAELEDILKMNFYNVAPEVAAAGRIPVMISEHCLFAQSSAWLGKTDSSERTERFQPAKAGEFPYGAYQTYAFANEVRCASESEAGGRCRVGDLNFCGGHKDQSKFFLEDRKGQFYPVLTDPADCRSMILSHKETNLLMQKDELKKTGLKRFRIYVE